MKIRGNKVFGLLIALFSTIAFAIFILFYKVFATKPPDPQIKYGEFPFRLEYEINGEIIVIEDTVICEYDGIGWNEGVGKHRKWKQYLADNGGDDLLLLIIDDTKKIYASVGGAKYYMGDEEAHIVRNSLTPNPYIVEVDGNITRYRSISEEDLFEKYAIRFTNWEYSTPIVNSFN